MKIIEKIFDAETGIETINNREMTSDEMIEYESAKSKAEEFAKKQLEFQQARNALLERLGITQDEVKLLLG